MKTTTAPPSRRTALRALLLAPAASLAFSSPKPDASRGVNPRHLTPGGWSTHFSKTGEALHIWCNGVDVTADSFEAHEGAVGFLERVRPVCPDCLCEYRTPDNFRAASLSNRDLMVPVRCCSGPATVQFFRPAGGWVKRRIRQAGGLTLIEELLVGHVEFIPGGPLR